MENKIREATARVRNVRKLIDKFHKKNLTIDDLVVLLDFYKDYKPGGKEREPLVDYAVSVLIDHTEELYSDVVALEREADEVGEYVYRAYRKNEDALMLRHIGRILKKRPEMNVRGIDLFNKVALDFLDVPLGCLQDFAKRAISSIEEICAEYSDTAEQPGKETS